MPNLDMTETTISVPRYIKMRTEKLAKIFSDNKGRNVSQKEIVTELVNKAWKNNHKNL